MKISSIKKKIKTAIKKQFSRCENSITYVKAKDLLKDNPTAILIDVRSIQEYNEYHLNSAVCIPSYELQKKIPDMIENKNQMIILYCQTGARSKKAIKILEKLGYNNLYEIDGGIDNI